MTDKQQSTKIGTLRSGNQNLTGYQVSMPESLVGNRLAVFAQSGFGKTNVIKVILWGEMNKPYGKLVFDRRGEYVKATSNEQGAFVSGLKSHPKAKDKLILYTNKKTDDEGNLEDMLYQIKQFTIPLSDISPADLINLYPNITDPQREFLYFYEDEPNIYDMVMEDSKKWTDSNLKDWFASNGSKVVVYSIRKKLMGLDKKSFINKNDPNCIDEIFTHLQSGMTVVVDLSVFPSDRDRTFITTTITRKLFNKNLSLLDSREKGTGKIKTVIFFEEAQNLLSNERVREGSIFVDIAKEGRALEIGLVAITQQPSAISTDILSQFNSFIALHLEFMDDIQFLKKVAGNFDGLEMDLRRKVPGNAYLVTRLKPFAIPLKVFHFDQKFIDEHKEKVKDIPF